jgi:alkanesulfonate monooxygenase SsuD/methylene tetrahydromethanopterin reductase-like flavin-dependent oxidoreductase (luciferase family)
MSKQKACEEVSGMMNLITSPILTGHHVGGWRHRDAYADSVSNRAACIEMAKVAERGKLDAFFLADGNAVRDMDKPDLFAANYPSARPATFEPVTLYAALSQHTRNLGFVATATTTYEKPYTLARKFASLDLLSGGRAGWNVVTSSYAGDSLNYGKAPSTRRARIAIAVPRSSSRSSLDCGIAGPTTASRRTRKPAGISIQRRSRS